MTTKVLHTTLMLVALTACGVDDRTRPKAEGSPATAPVAIPTEVALATRVLREGPAGIPESASPGDDTGEATAEHEAVTTPRAVRRFLEVPIIHSAVQFSCAVRHNDTEDALVAALTAAADTDAVVALAVLIRVRAPRHIVEQWQALSRLDLRHRDDPAWREVLTELRRPFSPADIDEALRAAPPPEPHGSVPALEWSARAAGVTHHAGALERLIELSRGAHLHLSLAAERSLEDFPGSSGDSALVQCLLGWRYDAYMRAGTRLLERDRELLARTLIDAPVPDDARWQAGLMLAALENPAAVPHLCASVGGRAMIDGKMFDAIERLATSEHLALVEALPAGVREEQRERATGVVSAVKARLGR